ncbi:hypothetical protein E2320_006176, partial [Naja naja]
MRKAGRRREGGSFFCTWPGPPEVLWFSGPITKVPAPPSPLVRALDEQGDTVQILLGVDHDRLRFVDLHRVEEFLEQGHPVDGRSHLPSSHFVVDHFLIPELLLGGGDVGQGGLEVQDLLHLWADRGLLLPTDHHSKLDHEVQYSLEGIPSPDWSIWKGSSSERGVTLGTGEWVVQVIRGGGEWGGGRAPYLNDVAAGILRVDADRDGEEGAQVVVGHHSQQHLVEAALSRGGPIRLPSGSDPPAVWPAALYSALVHAGLEALEGCLVVFPKLVEDPPAGVSVRDGVALDPPSACILEEVLAGVHSLIQTDRQANRPKNRIRSGSGGASPATAAAPSSPSWPLARERSPPVPLRPEWPACSWTSEKQRAERGSQYTCALHLLLGLTWPPHTVHLE